MRDPIPPPIEPAIYPNRYFSLRSLRSRLEPPPSCVPGLFVAILAIVAMVGALIDITAISR